MIKKEFYRQREDGVNLYRSYSDVGFMIENEVGQQYSEAIDVEDANHTYTETDIPIEEELTDTEALNIIMGRDADEPENSNAIP